MLEGFNAGLRAKPGGIQGRSGLREADRRFRIEAVNQGNGIAGIEGVTATAGAFDLDVEGGNAEACAILVAVVGAIAAQGEYAAGDPLAVKEASDLEFVPEIFRGKR